MQFHATGASAARQRTACAIVGIHENGVMTAPARELDRASGGVIARLLRRGDFAGKTAEGLPVSRHAWTPEPALVGLGARAGSAAGLSRAIVAATQCSRERRGEAISFSVDRVRTRAYYAARHAVESGSSTLIARLT